MDSELLCTARLFKGRQVPGELSLWPHHEGWKHYVPVVEQSLAVIREEILQAQVGLDLDLLILVAAVVVHNVNVGIL